MSNFRSRVTLTWRSSNNEGNQRHKKEQLKEAQRNLFRFPNDPRSYLCLAWHLANNNRSQEAILAWTKGHLLLPFDEDVNVAEDESQAQMNAWSHDVFGDILLKSGAIDQAREEWKKASDLDKHGVGDAARRKLKENRQETV